MDNLYYTPPTEKQFQELKLKCIMIWQKYDNTYGYVDEKVNKIKDLKNVSDNFMYMVAMFDPNNQAKLANKLSQETREAVHLRLVAGGTPPEYDPFMNVIERLLAISEQS